MHTYERADCENSKHILLHFTICTSHVREGEIVGGGGEGRGRSMNGRGSLPFLCLNKAIVPKSRSIINTLTKNQCCN